MKKPSSPSSVVRSQVDSRQAALGKAERDLIRRHQAAAREIERWDMARELRPHTPRLAKEAMDQDEAPDVMKVIHDWAGPGPRTGTHPMATRVPEPPRSAMATRMRPPLEDFGPDDELVGVAVRLLVMFAVLMGGAALLVQVMA